ncbi:neuroblast differentiation-associated protein AHNAK-like [Seriola dumerili]|uniref:neuroblast differentiation-associated protein AHNAK-like n=1 Tax=Seriola dumerili TaxID=41447 RepID=UPI000BBEF58D|nr:neuroblast differentiation-associated protein AHNAK-like [Seriola dumerili]
MPHMKMPDVGISLPKGKIGKVDISLPKGKPSIEGPGIEIKRDGGQFKMPNVDISIPKGKSSINTPEERVEAEGGTIKLPHIKMPKVDISFPKGKSKDTEALAVEMEVPGGEIKGPDVQLPKGAISVPKGTSSKAQINLPTIEAGGKIGVPQVTSPDLDISVTPSKLKQDTEAHADADLHVEGEHKGLKLKMPTIDIKGPKGDLELDIGLHRGEGKKDRKKVELPDLDLSTAGTSSKVKGPKVKGTKFKIGMPKKKAGKDATAEAKTCKNCGSVELGGQVKHVCKVKERCEYEVEVETHNEHKEDKGHINISVPEVTLPGVSLKTKQESVNLETGGEVNLSSPSAEIKVPRIPDIEFDIGTSRDEGDDKTEKGKKIKIPKFGVPLPSISSPEGRLYGAEIQYEGPKMPKVKKAVFVLVDPPKIDEPAPCTGVPEEEPTAEAVTGDVKVKLPKIKMKPNYGKSKDKSAAVSTERGGEGEEKSKGGKMKMPKVSFSPGKSGSFDVSLKGEGSSLNGEKDASPHKGSKDDKGTFSGKIKLPKVELTSPYGTMAAGEEDTEMSVKLGKGSSTADVGGDAKGLEVKSGNIFGSFSEETSKDVVSSHARTDMLDRDSSESPAGSTMEFRSTKIGAWSEVESKSRESEERESSAWFKVPKFTLKPHSTGFLQITPEGSPQAQRKGEVGGEVDVLGSFCLHTSGPVFTTQEMSEEHQVSSTKEGTVTMVTKTSRTTQHTVTTETRTGEASTITTTTQQVSDLNY